ncbi:Erp26 protein [Borreliella burgdorferi]|uniref:Erp26 protein n=1 Tax=Borreliella burgdorferi TaxID=139 RepID=UPI00016B2F5E|nr:Erp26 protein [Borreliella burgdorferi]ACO38048.1 Erp26 protein [Borreliella burgdorferi Bol26]MCD2322203.1 ErpC protein [Borreliella burgdorferi]MCD2379168.1 ErpC protein [Borreliella burgdorferi]PRR15851.1 ErpC protein [Borreliella burgdorferi]PRR30597.1 ErpC protein [Borreliella burgdorferi]
MNKKMKMFIICAVFALMISCKIDATGKDIKQNVKEQVQGFVDKILDPVKDKIASNGPIADELAKKLQEEELMHGDDPNNILIGSPPVFPASGNDNALTVKAEGQSGDQQEGKAKEAEAKAEEEKAEDKKEIQEGEEENVKEKELAEEQKREKKQQQEETKDKEAEEIRRKRIEQYKKEEKERLERKKQREERKRLRESESSENFLERVTRVKISTVAKQIDRMISDIDSINQQSSFEERMEVSGKEVEDKVTGAIYDDITDQRSSGNSIYSHWSDDFEENSELEGILENLESARTGLRSKIKEGKGEDEKNKNVVKVIEIKEDLEKVKSGLEKVKEYLKDSSKFEEIKGYVANSIS